MRTAFRFLSLTVASLTAFGQVSADNPTFEVASLKLAKDHVAMKCTGGPGTSDPGRFACSNAPLAMLLNLAYNNQFYQLKGQPWMYTDGYDLAAVVPPTATRPQMRIMLQSLLAERLQVAVHHETREAPSYSLVVKRSGFLLKPLSPNASPAGTTESAMQTSAVDGHWRLTARKQPMRALAGYLSVQLQSQVTDDTALIGEYDFTLDFMPEQTPSVDPQNGGSGVPHLADALQDQIGLQLELKNRPMDFLVVDRANKVPTEN